MQPVPVAEITRIDLNVADLDRSTQFYVQALGFKIQDAGRQSADPGLRLLRLGGQEIALVQAPADAAAYPAPRHANDPWFQHFAIAVSDMDAAYRILSAHPHETISRGGPQKLPPSTGSVIAYKFRDPDGHPLELSYIPNSAWLEELDGSDSPFKGIDHTALAVSDLEEAVAFYRSLGLQETGRFVNRGPEQDRLDGLHGVVLDIATLSLPAGGPHVELLAYRSPAPGLRRTPANRNPSDIASTCTRLRTLQSLAEGAGNLYDSAGHRLSICH